MHPDVLKLMALQALDLEAKRLRDEIAALPRQVSALETKAKATEGQRAVVLDLLAKEEALRRRQESDVQDLRTRLSRARAKANSAANAQQANALEHEATFAEAEIRKLEDAELESMMRSEGLEAQKTVADAALAADQQAFTRARDQAVEIIDRNNVALTDVDGRRGLQRATIDETVLSVYDRVARSKGTGLSEALDGKCTACQMLLRPQRWNDLRDRSNTELMTCESCGRLLFYDPARDSPQPKPAMPGRPAPATRKPAEPERKESIAAQIVRGSIGGNR